MAAEAPPSDNLYIGDLPVQITEDQLRTVFGAYGTVSQAKLLQAQQGKNSSALVRFASQQEATWVKDNLNGNIAQGLTGPIIVRYANPPGSGKGKKGDGKGSGPYGGGKGDGKAAMMGWGGDSWGMGWSPKGKGKGKGKGSIKALKQSLATAGVLPGKWNTDEGSMGTLFVGGLPPDTTTEDLYEIFTPFGALINSRAMMDEWGGFKGFGFVNFVDPNAAQTAIQSLNGAAMPDGTTLKVSIKTPSTKGAGGKGM